MMTGSWAINTFFLGCIILMVIPTAVYFYKEVITADRGETSDI